FQRGKKFFPWLYTIGLNHARNFLRHNKRIQWVSLEDCAINSELDHPCQQEDNICAKLDYAQLREALNQLPLDYREALMLRYHEGLSMDEVAEAMTLKLSAAKMRVHRGLAKLRDILERKQNEK
ncbi:MAG: RNA polymerase sigma factor, partial [Syntrophobacteraceae bacterium]